MSTELGIWLTPLLLLPGVGLLIMSTAARFDQLHGEFHRLAGDAGARAAGPLERRAALMQRALTCLYAAVAALSGASLLGGVLVLAGRDPVWAMLPLVFLGIGGVMLAAGLLVRESALSLEIVRRHAAALRREA